MLMFRLSSVAKYSRKINGLSRHGTRCITTKQPTSSTAAVPKSVEDFQPDFQSSNSFQSVHAADAMPKKRWQSATTKKVVLEKEAPLPVHTCLTREENAEEVRKSFVSYPPDADVG